MMNGIMNGRVYDWAFLLAERMNEVIMMQHKTFYMPHYSIGLFLDAIAWLIPNDRLEIKPSQIELGEPPIMQWKHLDTPGGQKAIGQKRMRQEMESSEHENTNSGSKDTSSEDVDDSEEEVEDEGDDEEVEVITAPPLLFSRSLTATSHLHIVPASVHIPGFKQFR